jgi:hypothetical protein
MVTRHTYLANGKSENNGELRICVSFVVDSFVLPVILTMSEPSGKANYIINAICKMSHLRAGRNCKLPLPFICSAIQVTKQPRVHGRCKTVLCVTVHTSVCYPARRKFHNWTILNFNVSVLKSNVGLWLCKQENPICIGSSKEVHKTT